MEAYEFQTALSDGVIQIPIEYRNKLSGKVRVILMQDDVIPKNRENREALSKIGFPYFAIDTTGYVFNREEANER
jgi:hypothetical protein